MNIYHLIIMTFMLSSCAIVDSPCAEKMCQNRDVNNPAIMFRSTAFFATVECKNGLVLDARGIFLPPKECQ